jgi:hypothetical protein
MKRTYISFVLYQVRLSRSKSDEILSLGRLLLNIIAYNTSDYVKGKSRSGYSAHYSREGIVIPSEHLLTAVLVHNKHCI